MELEVRLQDKDRVFSDPFMAQARGAWAVGREEIEERYFTVRTTVENEIGKMYIISLIYFLPNSFSLVLYLSQPITPRSKVKHQMLFKMKVNTRETRVGGQKHTRIPKSFKTSREALGRKKGRASPGKKWCYISL